VNNKPHMVYRLLWRLSGRLLWFVLPVLLICFLREVPSWRSLFYWLTILSPIIAGYFITALIRSKFEIVSIKNESGSLAVSFYRWSKMMRIDSDRLEINIQPDNLSGFNPKPMLIIMLDKRIVVKQYYSPNWSEDRLKETSSLFPAFIKKNSY
jgi:hypothetical protein